MTSPGLNSLVSSRHHILVHVILLLIAAMTLTPFAFVLNNSLRTNTEQNYSFFGLPHSLESMVKFSWFELRGQRDKIMLRVGDQPEAIATDERRASEIPFRQLGYRDAMSHLWRDATRGYTFSWQTLRPYLLNSIIVCVATVFGVVIVSSISAYVFSRYRFPGGKGLFLAVLSFMMIPGILTLVPSFLLVKKLGLLNSLWVLILPYVAGGQVVAIFLFKGFFDGLPNELFESARLDGAGHLRLYWHIVLPLSRQIIAVVAIINTLGAWNNFLWPFITNSDDNYHVIASGLYVMSQSTAAANYSAMYASYVLASIPLLVLFIYATRPFMAGVTGGAFKA
jgi:ABC-type glycerol-3-phosphate transport system permease component